MKHLKKALSLILTAAIVMSMGVFVIPAVKTVAQAAYRDIAFYVPECMYVNTASGTHKYYLNSLSYCGGATESVGRFYFYCPGATYVSVSCSASLSYFETSAVNGDRIVDDGFHIEGAYWGDTNIRWTVTYVVDGITKTATSYTWVYYPNRVPTGAAGETESDKHSRKYDYHGTVTALWGSQAFDQCGWEGNQQPKSPSYRMLLDVGGSMVRGNNDAPHACGYFDGGYGNTFHYHDNDNKNITVTSPYCYFRFDSSRFANINQIPNFSFGLACTDD